VGSELRGVIEVERTSTGDLLLVEDLSFDYYPRPVRVLLVASPDTPWLAVAVARESLRALLARRLMFRLTRAAHVTVDLLAGHRRVARRSMAAHAGLNRVDLPRRVRPGLYQVRLRARHGH
jgi:hypothetical protein